MIITMNKKSNVPEKEINRYVFVCMGLILYLMPCLSCLWLGMASDGLTGAYIFAIATEVLSVPVGFLGISAMKKPALRKWCIFGAAVLMAAHVACIVLLTTWYLIMAPTLVLLALFIPWSSVVKKFNN